MYYRHFFYILFAFILCSCGPSAYVPQESDYSQDEAVNIGYSKVRKRDMTGSVSKIKVREDDISGYADIFEYLRGRVAGVDVQGSGSGAVVRVRGERSILGNNDPLWIVDGAEWSDVSTIPPTMIKSVEVLKDASTTAMYGARGANGVILITLKDGQ